MRPPWTREVCSNQPRPVSRAKQLELDAAKQILAEVFHIYPTEVDDMLLKRIEERSGHQEHQDGLWPATFCLGD